MRRFGAGQEENCLSGKETLRKPQGRRGWDVTLVRRLPVHLDGKLADVTKALGKRKGQIVQNTLIGIRTVPPSPLVGICSVSG